MLQPYGLEMCKTKEQKVALLDEAIKMHDGNAITAVGFLMQSEFSLVFCKIAHLFVVFTKCKKTTASVKIVNQ